MLNIILQEKGDLPTLDVDFKYEFSHLKDIVNKIPFEDFISSMKADTTTISWKNYDLKNAAVVDKDHLPRSPNVFGYTIVNILPASTPDSIIQKLRNANKNNVIVLVDRKMSKKQIAAKRKEAVEMTNIPIEEKEYYTFSKPIYSENNEYVLISLSKSYRGAMYIFKREGNFWVKVLQFQRWVS